ncbi:MAG: hypothetical protein OXC82_00265 [Rhodobacteraceae bacterium]|nr:hypothetical protein [Paracoccaceae bacterium]MCY4248860.1 hypothetical protein [Paracoccaceae bacterium]
MIKNVENMEIIAAALLFLFSLFLIFIALPLAIIIRLLRKPKRKD